MRLLELRLIAFGPFTDVALDLSRGSEGLHVIYGPNEAGKSSALRGLHDLLYGIHARTTDNFVHEMRDMRIGGRIRRVDGTALEFVRRKGNKDTLLSTDDQPLGDQALDPFLAGVQSETFKHVFGIGHAILVKGGNQLLEGGGDLGENLFAAGLGATGFRRVLEGIDSEADKLFKPRGQTQAVNKALSGFLDARRRIRETSLKERDWRDLRDQTKEAQRQVDELSESARDLRRRSSGLERMSRLIPLVNRWRECQTALDEIGDVTILPESFPDDRRECESRLKGAREAAAAAKTEIARLDKSLQGIDLPEVLLDVADAVAQLKEDIGEYRKHGKDLPKRLAELNLGEKEAAGILAEIRPDLDLKRVDEIRLSQADVRRIRNLLKAHEGLAHDEEAAKNAIQEANGEIREVEAELGVLPEPRDPGPLGRLLKRLQGLGDLDAMMNGEIEKSKAVEQDCGIRARRLSGWNGAIEDLADLPVPDPAVIDRFEQDFAEARRGLDGIRDDLKKCSEDRLEAEKNLAAMENAGSVPLEQDLEHERGHRDQGWAHVRDAWRDGKALDVVEETYDPDQPLADAFEASVKVADDVSDRLRREADRVNRRADLKAEIDQFTTMLETLTSQKEGGEARLEELEGQWKRLWSNMGVVPEDPRSMRGWLTEYKEFRRAWDSLREANLEVERLSGQIETARNEIGSLLEPLGEAGPGTAEGLQELIGRALGTVDAIRQTEERRARLEDLQRKKKLTLDQKIEAAAEIGKRALGWDGDWAKAMKKVGLDAKTPVSEVEDKIERLERLFGLVDESGKLQLRIKGMERDRKRFETQVEGLLKRIGPDAIELPEGLDPVAQVQWLDHRVAEARTLAERRDNLKNNLDRQKDALVRAKDMEQAAEKEMKDLCRQAGCDDSDQLARLEKLSSGAVKLQDDIAALRQQIAAEAGDRSVEDAILDAQDRDPDVVAAEKRDIEEQIEEIEARKTLAATSQGTLKERLEHLEGGVLATEAAEEAESALARMRDGVLQYVPLRLAGAILRREVEAYRQQHQGPLVTRAGELFSKLTLGAFVSLAPSWEEDDRPVLVGIRSGGERVRVEHLSDGTRDQLYLALRLASLEMHVERNEPMPFVVDDVLIHFDDDRARAGLEVLAEISNKTQVILFTHHKRIVELAREAVSKKTLFTQELNA